MQYSSRRTREETGTALIELALVASVILLMLFASIRLALLTASVPVTAENLNVLLESLPLSAYNTSFSGIRVDVKAVEQNLNDLVRPVSGKAKVSRVLGLEKTDHSIHISAFNCDCNGSCSNNPIASSSVSAGMTVDKSGSAGRIRTACVALHNQIKSSWACEGIKSYVCYGASAKFDVFFETRELGAVVMSRPSDASRTPPKGAGDWLS